MEGPPGPVGNLGQVGPQGILNIMGFGCIILIIIGPSGIPGRQFYTEGPRGAQGKAGQFVGGIKINNSFQMHFRTKRAKRITWMPRSTWKYRTRTKSKRLYLFN